MMDALSGENIKIIGDGLAYALRELHRSGLIELPKHLAPHTPLSDTIQQAITEFVQCVAQEKSNG